MTPRQSRSRTAGCAPLRTSLVIYVLLSACSSRSGAATDGPVEPQPIAECVAYEKALSRCTGRDASVAGPALKGVTSEADRAYLRDLCALNLQRLNSSCR
jgi:hypothetical protein